MTLIASGTLLWSGATALCGLAGGFVPLLGARMAVGLGEAIGLPGLQSVVADYFPAVKRGMAMSVLMLAPPIGAMIGFVGGGLIAQEYDWRFTFMMAAIPGVVLAALAWFLVHEPRRGAHDLGASDDVPPITGVLARLFTLPSARHLVIASGIASMIGFGLNYFFTSLMIRKFEVGLAEAGLYAGVIASAPAAVSTVLSGVLGDRYGAQRPGAYALIPAIALVIGGLLYPVAITRDSLAMLLALVCIATFFTFSYVGITFAALQNLMHPRMRATATAVLGGVYGISGALGPLALGWISDTMAATRGPAQGLAAGMAIFGALYLWAALHYLLAARRYGADLAGTQPLPPTPIPVSPAQP
jgi:MFS family permease